MNELQIFENIEFGAIRIIEMNNEPWFVGKDVAAALGYERATKAIQDHISEEDKDEVPIRDSIGRMQKTPVINESGVYALIFGSKLPSARKFKHWVTSEVLPAIRKTGQYGQARIPMTIPEQIQCIAQGHVELKAEIDSVKKDLEDFKNDLPVLGIEEARISNAVKQKGIECLGGKDSNAYNDKSIRGKLYSDLHRQIRREFGVSTYKAIRRNQTDTAIEIIQSYVPPLILSEEIGCANAQQKLSI